MVLARLAFASALTVLCAGNVIDPPNKGQFDLLILHNNDMHARFEQTSRHGGVCTDEDLKNETCYGGFARVAYVVNKAREDAKNGKGPPVLYLNAGDTYTGTPWFTLYKAKIAVDFINTLQPDAISLGNHEFDDSVSGLIPFIRNVTCPVLAANLILNNVPELENESNLKKSIIININNSKVGIIGYLTPETKFLAKPNKVEYVDEIVALKKESYYLKEKGANIIIALGHSGYLRDLQIAKEVELIDLVIGGHTNTFLWNGTTLPDVETPKGFYPTYSIQNSGKIVPVVQAYAYTKYLGRLLISFDAQGKLVVINGNPILLDKTIPQDIGVLKIVEKYRSSVFNIAHQIVGSSLVYLDGQSCHLRECNLGNLITDAMVLRYVSDYHGDSWTDAPIAIIQGGGIRSSVELLQVPTTITTGHLLTLMPFEGNNVIVTMNGSTLLKMIEHSVINYNTIDVPGAFLQYSGLRVVYDLAKPRGSRVKTVEVKCGLCKIPEFENVDIKKSYKVLMPIFLADGGDGYSMLKGLAKIDLPYNELACTDYYIRHRSPIFPGVEGRVTLLNVESLTSGCRSNFLISSSWLLGLIAGVFGKID